ncbi:MAG: GNAT family N-acetyltransferase [Gammaproteobacteria bacterium]|nr:GNAT family N-acetyltransferase [Gammaproteobacteria bacterium]
MKLETERLEIRELILEDAPFVVELLNSEAFIVNIGDRGVHNLQLAEEKIQTTYSQDYPNYGLFIVVRKSDNTAIGTVSYLKRDYLEKDDIGYAFLPQFWGQGFALEATKSVLQYQVARGEQEIWGVVDRTNRPSIRLLEKLDFHEAGEVVMEGEDPPIVKMVFQSQK